LNCVAAPVLERAHPSGTLTNTRPPGAVNGTYTWLSGISPGGFDSVSARVGAAGADAPEVPTLGWFGIGVAVTAPHHVSSAVRLTTTKPTRLFAPNFITPPPGLVRLRR